MTSLNKLAIRGTAWTIAGYGLSQSLRFGSNLVLTRLLVPELFGLMALVQVFLTGLNLFSDIGIRPSIIQNKRGDDLAFLNTAWTVQVIRGFLLWFACVGVSWFATRFYSEPRLLWLLPAVGLTTIINGFRSTSLATLNRKMALGRLTMFNAVSQIAAIVVMVVWAWYSPTIWALVGGNLIASLLSTIWSHLLVPDKPNWFTWDRSALKELFSFGKWIFVATAMMFLASQADRLILGKLLSFEMLGVYTIAYTIADIPRQVMKTLGGNVIFPLLSKLADQPREVLRLKILRKRRLVLLAVGSFLALMVSFSDLLITGLYDDRYAQAASMVPLLSLGLWHTMLYATMSSALMAVGKPLYAAMGNLCTFLTLCIGLPLGFSLGGVMGAVLAVALSDLPSYGIISCGLWREKLSSLLADLQATAFFVAVLSLILASRYFLGYGLPIEGIL